MLKLQFRGTLKVVFFNEDDKVVAFCPALDLSTCGNDIKEAKANFGECLKIYLEETIKHGTLEQDLFKLGWKTKPRDLSLYPPAKPHQSIPTHILKSIHIPIPVAV